VLPDFVGSAGRVVVGPGLTRTSRSAGLPWYQSPVLPDFVGLDSSCGRRSETRTNSVPDCAPILIGSSCRRRPGTHGVRKSRSAGLPGYESSVLPDFGGSAVRVVVSPGLTEYGCSGADRSGRSAEERWIGELVTDMSARLRDMTVPVHLSWDCRTYRVRQLGGANANRGSRRSERRCR